jgi:glycosyltransferase involved in cell wall biosynthesis
MKNLYLFTRTFPYGYGETFLENEIPYLSKRFKVTIVPDKIEDGYIRTLDKSVVVDNSWADKSVWERTVNVFNREILSDLKNYIRDEIKIIPHNYNSIKQAISFLAYSVSQRNWFLDKYRKSLKCGDILYSYWLYSSACAIGLVKKNVPYVNVISRAHRYDLYEKRPDNILGYVPFRNLTLVNLDRVFVVSQHGTDYLRKKYKKYTNKIKLSRLGVKKAPRLNPTSRKKVFRIVSCSSMNPVKRVSIIIEGISILSKNRPKDKIEWIHFGDGPLRKDIEEKSRVLLVRKNVSYKLMGNVSNKKVLGYYKRVPVDLFVNVSSSEGLPVSIMEALSFGIPVIASDIGGMRDIVNYRVGKLLSSNPDPEEIADTMEKIMKLSPKKVEKKRKSSVDMWNNKVNARVNFLDFVNTLIKL